MWDLPGPGLEPMSPALAGGFPTTAAPGKPRCSVLMKLNHGCIHNYGSVPPSESKEWGWSYMQYCVSKHVLAPFLDHSLRRGMLLVLLLYLSQGLDSNPDSITQDYCDLGQVTWSQFFHWSRNILTTALRVVCISVCVCVNTMWKFVEGCVSLCVCVCGNTMWKFV